MSDLFMTFDELTELTGYKQTRGHVRWLEQNRWRFAVTASQQPRVTRAYFHERMGVRVSRADDRAGQAALAAVAAQPDFSALDRH